MPSPAQPSGHPAINVGRSIDDDVRAATSPRTQRKRRRSASSSSARSRAYPRGRRVAVSGAVGSTPFLPRRSRLRLAAGQVPTDHLHRDPGIRGQVLVGTPAYNSRQKRLRSVLLGRPHTVVFKRPLPTGRGDRAFDRRGRGTEGLNSLAALVCNATHYSTTLGSLVSSRHAFTQSHRAEALDGRLPPDRASPCRRGLIAEHDGHFTAGRARDSREGSSAGDRRATLFSGSDLLTELGVGERLDLPTGEHAYVHARRLITSVICSRCGRATDVEDSGVAEAVPRSPHRSGYRIDSQRSSCSGSAGIARPRRHRRLIGLFQYLISTEGRINLRQPVRLIASALRKCWSSRSSWSPSPPVEPARVRRVPARARLGSRRARCPQGRNDDDRLAGHRPECRRRRVAATTSIIPPASARRITSRSRTNAKSWRCQVIVSNGVGLVTSSVAPVSGTGGQTPHLVLGDGIPVHDSRRREEHSLLARPDPRQRYYLPAIGGKRRSSTGG